MKRRWMLPFAGFLGGLSVAVVAHCLPSAQPGAAWRFDARGALVMRTAIRNPKDGGYATVSVGRTYVGVLIESDNGLRHFPFDAIEGPLDKTPEDYILFQTVRNGRVGQVRAGFNAWVPAEPERGYQFACELAQGAKVVAFLAGADNGAKLLIRIHSRNNAVIELECPTEGLGAGIRKLMK
jgi:hypothetical protein